MLALSWPVQWLAFIPVVVGEAAVVGSRLGLQLQHMLKPVLLANLWSTMLGVPLAWLAMLMVEIMGGLAISSLPEHFTNAPLVRYLTFPLFIAWIGGSNPLEFRVAFVIIMCSFCWVSICIEHRVLRRHLPAIGELALRRSNTQANIASYSVLTAITLIVLALTS